MDVRASGPFSRLGWMLLGAVVLAVCGAFVYTLVFTNTPAALISTVFYLLLIVPCAVVCAVIAWTGYLIGSRIAVSRGARESTDLLWSAGAALTVGVLVIVVASIGLGDSVGGFLAFSLGAALLGSVVSVSLARLPLDAGPRQH